MRESARPPYPAGAVPRTVQTPACFRERDGSPDASAGSTARCRASNRAVTCVVDVLKPDAGMRRMKSMDPADPNGDHSMAQGAAAADHFRKCRGGGPVSAAGIDVIRAILGFTCRIHPSASRLNHFRRITTSESSPRSRPWKRTLAQRVGFQEQWMPATVQWSYGNCNARRGLFWCLERCTTKWQA